MSEPIDIIRLIRIAEKREKAGPVVAAGRELEAGGLKLNEYVAHLTRRLDCLSVPSHVRGICGELNYEGEVHASVLGQL